MQSLCGWLAAVLLCVSPALPTLKGRIRPCAGVSWVRWCCCGEGWGSRSRFCRRSHLSKKLSRNPGSRPARNLDLEPKVTLGPYCQHGRS